MIKIGILTNLKNFGQTNCISLVLQNVLCMGTFQYVLLGTSSVKVIDQWQSLQSIKYTPHMHCVRSGIMLWSCNYNAVSTRKWVRKFVSP